jgi:hypothetical protein
MRGWMRRATRCRRSSRPRSSRARWSFSTASRSDAWRTTRKLGCRWTPRRFC